MTKERIAELFRLTWPIATVNPQRDKQALKECLNEIERLQKVLDGIREDSEQERMDKDLTQ
jgi:hypothetical protein